MLLDPRDDLFKQGMCEPIVENVELEAAIEARIVRGSAESTVPGETPITIIIGIACCAIKLSKTTEALKPIPSSSTNVQAGLSPAYSAGTYTVIVRAVSGKTFESVNSNVNVLPTGTAGWGRESGPNGYLSNGGASSSLKSGPVTGVAC